MRFKKIIAGIMAVLAITMCCAACGNTEEESSSSKRSSRRSTRGTTVSDPDDEDDSDDEDETRATKRSSRRLRNIEITEAETEKEYVTETTSESIEITTGKKRKTTTTATTTTTAATTSITTTTADKHEVAHFQECSPSDGADGYTVYANDNIRVPDEVEMGLPDVVTDDANYVSDYQSKRFFWLDIEKNIDYVFNGKFIKITLKVKKDAPVGDYPVGVKTDCSTTLGKSLNGDIANLMGEIGVGRPDPVSESFAKMDYPYVVADFITAKQGETVDYYISFENNPGVAAFLITICYDANAFEWLSAEPCGEYAQIPSARRLNN